MAEKKFELVDFERAPRVNEWVEPVSQLATAIAHNPKASFRIPLDVKDEGKEISAFRAAAKDIGKTVRILVRDDSAVTKVGQKENGKPIYEGQVVLTVTLTEKYADGRGRKPKTETEDAGASAKSGK